MKKLSLKNMTVILIGLIAFILVNSNSVVAQIPDTFTNLKILDTNITKPELIDKMKEMTNALGVRCEFCHKGDPAQGFSSFDFTSDEKEHKKAARVMMIMTADINRSHLSKLSELSDESPQEVSCYSCHHGDKKPRVLQDEIETALTAGGLETAVARYKELKEIYYGSSVFDFTENSLNLIAMDVFSSGQTENAIGLLRLNEEEHPESVGVKEMFAMIYMSAGQIPEAIEACKKVLEIDPDNQRIQGLLKRLEGQ